MGNGLRRSGRALAHTLREWSAGLGLVGALIACVATFAENVQGTLPGVVGLVLAPAGILSGLLALRTDGTRGRLLAAAAPVLAIAAFVLLNAATGRDRTASARPSASRHSRWW